MLTLAAEDEREELLRRRCASAGVWGSAWHKARHPVENLIRSEARDSVKLQYNPAQMPENQAIRQPCKGARLDVVMTLVGAVTNGEWTS